MHDDPSTIWQSHAIKFLECAFRTDRQEVLHRPDGYGKMSIECGDTLEFFLVMKDQRIEHIAYATNGCLNTNACANAVIDLAQGRSQAQALRITSNDVARYLESLPQDHLHCAELAVGALKAALAAAFRSRQDSWKKAYR